VLRRELNLLFLKLRKISDFVEMPMKKKLVFQIADGLGMGCTVALKISTIAFVGVAAVQLMNSFGYLNEVEQSAKRVMWMSVIIGGSAVLGGAVAGALSDENTDVLIDAIVEERKKVEKLERDNHFIREQMKLIQNEVETERKERISRGDRLRQKQRRIEELETTIAQLKQQLPLGSQTLKDWQDWEELVHDLWGTEYCVSSCRNCKYLDASSYENRYVICAIHPYGKKDCADWEAKI
jgi:hypothetical protein